MTHKEWNDLPLLLTRSQFLACTGLHSNDLSALVRTGNVSLVEMPSGSSRKGATQRARYRKLDAARLVGLSM